MKALFLFFIGAFSLLHPSSSFELLNPCIRSHYSSLCKSELVSSCYECYNHVNNSEACVPLFDDIPSSLEKYPRSDWNCTLHHPSQNEYTFQDIKDTREISYPGKVFYACSGDTCMNEGWQVHIKYKGKHWCGIGSCFKTHSHVVCTKPQYCDKDL